MAERSGELETKNTDRDFENQTNDDATEEMKNTSADSTQVISDDPDEIRGQIEETRRDMGETLDAIQEKLSVANISEQVKEQVSEHITDAVETLKTTVSDATIGRAGKFMKNLRQQLKDTDFSKVTGGNQLPLLFVGMGVGLLAYTAFNRKSSSKPKVKQPRNTASAQYTKAQQAEQSSGGKSIGEKAGGLYESVSDSAGTAYHSVASAASGAYDKIGDYSGQYKDYLQENPLIVGAVALAVGAAVGLAIPSTEYENKLMGEARENLLAQAKDAVRGTFDKVQETVEQAKDTISDEIKKQTAAQQ